VTGHEFNPDWTIAPAATLAEWLKEQGMTVADLAATAVGPCTWATPADAERACALIQAVLDREPMTDQCAQLLGWGTGVSVQFWRNLEANYRADLAAGRTDTTPGATQ
jgi:hypothetical protein